MKRISPIFLSLFILAGTARAELITTIPSWNGSQRILGFGEANTATFGQTITVGSDALLESFSFRIRSENLFGAFPTRLAGYVMAWDEPNDRATGPVLYDSGLVALPFDSTAYKPLEFSPNLILMPGHQYVLMISTSAYQDGSFDQASLGYVRNTDSYLGGKFVSINNGTDTGLWTTQAWSGFSTPGSDLAFTAQLSHVPEPSSLLLVALGVVVLRCSKRQLAR